MRLVLHYTPSSPFCKFAFMTAIYKGIPLDLYISNPALPENQRLESVSPIRRVPVLEIYDDSGGLTILNDSMLICAYLDELSDNKAIKGGYEFITLCYNIRGIAERALSLFYETKREATSQSAQHLNNFQNTLHSALNHVEALLDTYPIKTVNLVSITLSTLLGYLDFRLSGVVDWRDNRPKLTAWFSNFQMQNVFQQTRSFEMAELEQGAIYTYDAKKEVNTSLDPLATFLMRAKIIQPASIASQQILSLKGDKTYA